MNLVDIRRKLDAKKVEKNRLEGRRDALLATLGEQGFKSIEEAEKEVEVWEKKIEKMKEKRASRLSQFRRKYEELLK